MKGRRNKQAEVVGLWLWCECGVSVIGIRYMSASAVCICCHRKSAARLGSWCESGSESLHALAEGSKAPPSPMATPLYSGGGSWRGAGKLYHAHAELSPSVVESRSLTPRRLVASSP